MKRTWAAVLLLLVPLLLGARQDDAQPVSIEDVPAAISDLLHTYSVAYLTHDEGKLVATVGQGILDRERRALDNAASLTFSEFEVVPVTQFSGNLASERIQATYRGKQVLTYQVTERSRIGAETDTFEQDGAFTFLREPGRDGFDGWRLVSKSDLDVLGFYSPHHLWDENDTVAQTSEHFVLLSHPGAEEQNRTILDAAEKGFARADAFWPGTQNDVVVIVVPSTTEELSRIMHETVDLSKFVAFVGAGVDRSRGYDPTGPRMFVHLSHLVRYGEPARVEILAHELIHAITRDVSGPMIPTWIEEGLANLGGGTGRPGSFARAGPTPDAFPTDELFTTGAVRDIQTVYDQAQEAIATLDATKGRGEVSEFYIELGSRRVVAGTDEYHVRDAIAKSAGWSYDAWVDAWRKRLG